MTQCPKCGKTLRLYHWRPECPYCGVNVVYYNSNDRMLAETEYAEIEHAHSQPRIDRAKAAFFGSPLAIVRIVLSALPIAALFLPLGRLSRSVGASFNVIGIYRYLSENSFDGVVKNALSGDALTLSLVLLALSVVLWLVCLICLPMSLGKHGKGRNLILNLLLLGTAAASAVNFALRAGTLLLGAYIYLFLLAVILVYNLLPPVRRLPIKHTVCYIGGLPSDEYFDMKAQGVSELVIRKKMVAALTAMQEEVRRKAAEEEAQALAKRAARR